jgi:multidrug efflux pump subunit AcrA (membrane-fusion protein)
VLLSFAVGACAAFTACRAPQAGEETGTIIVVNAPSAGVVRRVLVSEGARVEAGTPIVEIAIPQPQPVAQTSAGESAESRAANNVRASQAEIEAARAEVVRHEAEVQRLTPLVAAGQAAQAELDGERALYERAQQRLQQAQQAARQADTGLLAARQPNATPPPVVREQTVTANATSAGTVRVINTRVGDHVTIGQPLATIRGN